MSDEQPRCGNPDCGLPLTIVRGHRRRQYCDDACKMAAHRARLAAANQARYEALLAELAQREREAWRQRYGELPVEALDLLRSLKSTYGPGLAEQVAHILALVRDEAGKHGVEY